MKLYWKNLKKINIIFLLVITCCMFGCTKAKNEEFDSYKELSNYITESIHSDTPYYFLDFRTNKEYLEGHHNIFSSVLSEDALQIYIEDNNIKKKNVIVIMGANATDSVLEERYQYLLKKGFKNIKVYRGGYENLLTDPSFKPAVGPGRDCDC